MPKIISKEWLKSELEVLDCCPICESVDSKKIYEELEDKVFFCAPGKWNLYKCEKCNSIYLNPRPNKKSIVKAYSKYFTHDDIKDFKSIQFKEKIRILFSNGYRNWSYGTNDKPSNFLGVVIGLLWKNGQRIIDASMRNLPKPNKGSRLLDVGCGSSQFLSRAKSMGWDVTGIDFDLMAVKAARKQGF